MLFTIALRHLQSITEQMTKNYNHMASNIVSGSYCCDCRKLVELVKPTTWSLQGSLHDEVIPIDVAKKGDIFEVE